MAEQPINGTWELEGFFALDVRGLVRCTFSATLDLEQLPGGVNTVVGGGQHAFDCTVDGEPASFEDDRAIINTRLIGSEISMTWGVCNMVADYVASFPDAITNGRAFCQLSFPGTGLNSVAGTWEGTRQVVP